MCGLSFVPTWNLPETLIEVEKEGKKKKGKGQGAGRGGRGGKTVGYEKWVNHHTEDRVKPIGSCVPESPLGSEIGSSRDLWMGRRWAQKWKAYRKLEKKPLPPSLTIRQLQPGEDLVPAGVKEKVSAEWVKWATTHWGVRPPHTPFLSSCESCNTGGCRTAPSRQDVDTLF